MNRRLAALLVAPLLSFSTSSRAGNDLCPDVPGGPPGMLARDLPEAAIRRAHTMGGTTLDLGASGVDCETATKAYTEVFAAFDRLEKLTASSGEGSQLAAINAAAGKEAVAVDPELFALIQLALGFAKLTDGAFDPTFAALEGLWSFGEGGAPPSDEEIEARKKLVDWKKVVLDEDKRTVMLQEPGMKLGLGGIVKGYAIDKAVEILERHKVPHFLIRSGAEVYVKGNPGGGFRRIGVPDPRGSGSFALLDVRDRALNTSSDNVKFFLKGGVRYHHIIDARTGRPASRSRTVSVVAVDATSADALSTALFVLGPEKGLPLVEKLAGVEAIVVDDKNVVHLSSGISDRLELKAPTP